MRRAKGIRPKALIEKQGQLIVKLKAACKVAMNVEMEQRQRAERAEAREKAALARERDSVHAATEQSEKAKARLAKVVEGVTTALNRSGCFCDGYYIDDLLPTQRYVHATGCEMDTALAAAQSEEKP